MAKVQTWPGSRGGTQVPPSFVGSKQYVPVLQRTAGVAAVQNWPGPAKPAQVPQPLNVLQYRPASAWQFELVRQGVLSRPVPVNTACVQAAGVRVSAQSA